MIDVSWSDLAMEHELEHISAWCKLASAHANLPEVPERRLEWVEGAAESPEPTLRMDRALKLEIGEEVPRPVDGYVRSPRLTWLRLIWVCLHIARMICCNLSIPLQRRSSRRSEGEGPVGIMYQKVRHKYCEIKMVFYTPLAFGGHPWRGAVGAGAGAILGALTSNTAAAADIKAVNNQTTYTISNSPSDRPATGDMAAV